MTKNLLTLLIICSLSCNKDDGAAPKYDPPPTVTDIQASTETVNGVTYPKFIITLNVPDTAATEVFTLHHAGTTIPCAIANPKTGTYSIVDIYNPYPVATPRKTYHHSFIMEDKSSISHSIYTIN